MSTIGKRIRDRRIELGMSVDDLAARLCKNRATVYRYESDEIENFPVSIIGPLADVLGVSPAYLMGWTNEEKSVTPKDNGLSEIVEIFTELSPDNRTKLLELSRLYLNAQHNTGEKK
jgi:transcriptional regulator with XRE-family HTH domain